jgi:hypothetical protein
MSEGLMLKVIMEFFGYKKLTEFSKDWKALDERSREQLRTGLADGTFDYSLTAAS